MCFFRLPIVDLSTYFVTVVVTPLFSIADVAIAIGSRDAFGLFILLP
jgi:hypothetical protein